MAKNEVGGMTTDAPEALTPPAGNETGTIYAAMWHRSYGDHPRDPKGRFRRKVKP